MKSLSVSRHRLVASLTVLAFALQPVTPLIAANHTNSSVDKDEKTLHLTANVDWDYDGAAPVQVGTGGVAITTDVLRDQILREVARSVFLMTEGRHRIGTIYVYKNARYGANVDIQIINKDGRSFAAGAKWQLADGSTSNYLAMDKKAENLRNYARVIAHELGHYVYGLADEYREENKALNPKDPGGPAGNDFTRTTMMNNHENFTRLSLAEDYTAADQALNSNAQARVYGDPNNQIRGGSAWETLARDPKLDPAEGKRYHENGRVWFSAFKTPAVPAKLSDLKRYVGVLCPSNSNEAINHCGTGDASKDQLVPPSDRIATKEELDRKLWIASGGSATEDAKDGASGSAFEKFKVVFVDTPAAADQPTEKNGASAHQTTVQRRLAKTAKASIQSAAVGRAVLVIDRSLPDAAFEEAKYAAEVLIELAAPGTQMALVVSPGDATPLVPMVSVDNVTERARLVSAVRGLARQAGNFDAAAALRMAQALAAQGRADADTATLTLLTAQGSTVNASLGQELRQQRTAVNTIGFLLPVGSTATRVADGSTLEALASSTGGQVSNARNAEQAIKDAMRAERELLGEIFALMASATLENLPAGTRQESFTVTSHDKVVAAHFFFDRADKAKLSFQLVTAAGAVTSLSPDSDLDDGYALIEVDNSDGRHNGAARASMSASAAVTNPVGIDVQSESAVELRVDLAGGTLAENTAPVLRVKLAGEAPIIRARVTASVFDAQTGALVLGDLALVDDGAGDDSKADDGRYTLSLKDRLPPGEYTVSVRAETTAESVFQPNQRFRVGSEVPVTPVGAGLVRVETFDTTLQAGATGVKSASDGSSSGTGVSGGGCTSLDGQRDAGLLLLLLLAGLGVWLRRHRA